LRRLLLPDADKGVASGKPAANRTELSGRIEERGSLRYTPAGIPVIEFRVTHTSEQVEADSPRRVECEMACVALGVNALLLKEVPAGTTVTVTGFLAARSLKQKAPVLHVTNIVFGEFAETI
jgi:primosomal replication protein N